jgi:hypothetical protein
MFRESIDECEPFLPPAGMPWRAADTSPGGRFRYPRANDELTSCPFPHFREVAAAERQHRTSARRHEYRLP